MKIFTITVFCVITSVLPITANAWKREGHLAVAIVAEKYMTPAAKEVVAGILSQEHGATLVSISTWADRPEQTKKTGRWHYVNFPRGKCTYEKKRDCPDGECIVEAIKYESGMLRTGTADQKLIALKYLVHLIADIHQPLHGGLTTDEGGNNYYIETPTGMESLHTFWDKDMLRAVSSSVRGLAEAALSMHDPLEGVVGDPKLWAEQSCLIVSQPNFYPKSPVPDKYYIDYKPTVKMQILSAGIRLANLLNTFAEESLNPDDTGRNVH